MSFSTRPPLNDRFAVTRTDEVDEVLRCFYRAEMPHPWPAAPVVKAEAPPRRLGLGHFFRVPGRLAIAASVAALVIGYLMLQAWFPDPKPDSAIDKTQMGFRVAPGKGSNPLHNGAQPANQQTQGSSWLLPPPEALPATK
jgi:hypothetical protein